MPDPGPAEPVARGLLPPPVPQDADQVELDEIIDMGDEPLQPAPEPGDAQDRSEGQRRTGGSDRPNGLDRVAARERALGLLYEAEIRSVSPIELLHGLPIAPDPFAVFLVSGVAERCDELDAELSRVSFGWGLDRMPALDRAVLRIGTFELLDCPDVPIAVIINEAVELAKRFSTEDSSRFVNGVLSRLASDFR